MTLYFSDMSDTAAALLIIAGYFLRAAITWGIFLALGEDWDDCGMAFLWPFILVVLPFYGVTVGVRKLVEKIIG